ncbi:mast cell protease 1A-like [Pelodiscus sinensis]|uniref:mast cell protease 1A-like n=1 Tax=Pelodiscus sinensis TaxID=13735 RepID=UPI003F6A5614
MAYLEIQRRDERIRCGGFLVAENFVLTAARCQGDNITVLLGAHNVKLRERYRQRIQVCRQIPHPQYNRETLNNDIMLLQLENVAVLNRWVGTLALPCSGERVAPWTTCNVAGWGRTLPTVDCLSDTLQEVDVVVMPDATCLRHPYKPYRRYNPCSMMCVGDPAFLNDSAKGDSGGPVVCGGKAQGIVSWGICKAPSVYVKVSTFVPWIERTMRRL